MYKNERQKMNNSTPATPVCDSKAPTVLGRYNRPDATADLGASGRSRSSLSTRCSLTSRKLQFESDGTNGNTDGAPHISTESWRDSQDFSPPFQNATNAHFVLPVGHQQSPPLQPLQTRAHGPDHPYSCTKASPQNNYTGLRKYDMSEPNSGNGLNNETHSNEAMSRRLEAPGPSSISDINRCIVYSAQSNDLTAISNMLKTCHVFHPLDAVPKTPLSSPVRGSVGSLMDGGDALDVRGLASRLSKMQSETSMRVALQEYIHTHIPSVEGAVDSLIEDTVQQIATVSLRDKNPRRCVSGLTTTRDWLKLQNGGTAGESPSTSNNHGRRHPTSPDCVHSKSVSPNQMNLISTNHDQSIQSIPNQSGCYVYVNLPSTSSSRDGFHQRQICQIQGRSSSEMVQLNNSCLRRRNEHTLPECNCDNQVTEVYDIGGEVLHTDYVSPEERRYEHYLSKMCHRSKRKFQDVDIGEGHWGKRRMYFVREELTDSRVIRFNNGSWN